VAYTMAPLQNWEHGAGAFDLGDDAVVCVDASSSAVVADGHGCGRDGLKPSGRRTYRSGMGVDDDCPEPSWPNWIPKTDKSSFSSSDNVSPGGGTLIDGNYSCSHLRKQHGLFLPNVWRSRRNTTT
jgi:hypothetical protein